MEEPIAIPALKGNGSDTIGTKPWTKRGCSSRSKSFNQQCRICLEKREEALIKLGCGCRNDLATVHRSCIDTWFRIKGSNRCELCKHIAANVPHPSFQPRFHATNMPFTESQPSLTNYSVWRVAPPFRRSNTEPEDYANLISGISTIIKVIILITVFIMSVLAFKIIIDTIITFVFVVKKIIDAFISLGYFCLTVGPVIVAAIFLSKCKTSTSFCHRAEVYCKAESCHVLRMEW